MSIATETASEFYGLAAKAADRGMVNQAIHYSDRANEILLRGEQMRQPKHYYAPQSTHMSNAVKTSGCQPLYPRPRYWARRLFAIVVTVVLFVALVAAAFIINEAFVK